MQVTQQRVLTLYDPLGVGAGKGLTVMAGSKFGPSEKNHVCKQLLIMASLNIRFEV